MDAGRPQGADPGAVGTISDRSYLRRSLRFVAKLLSPAIFPPRCIGCGVFLTPPGSARLNPRPPAEGLGVRNESGPTALEGYLCDHCKRDVEPMASPLCSICGSMFASRRGGDHLCDGCMQCSRYYHRARAATTYSKVMKRIIHTYKYGGHIRLADPLAALLQDAYRRYWPEGGIDLVLPIPLHRRRFRRRGFNQAYLLMHPRRKTRGTLARVPTDLRALVRVRATPAQAGLGRADRRRNIRDAFQVRMPRSVEGRKILLVDDVYTTGATVEECSRVLIQAGAQRVEALTVARAMPGYMAGAE